MAEVEKPPSVNELPETAEPENNTDAAKPEQDNPARTSNEQPYTSKKHKKSGDENCCQKCCGSLMKVCAHDAIYGSFVGPHPVTFLCCCLPFKKCVDPECTKPFSVSSIATKTMYFIMLAVTTILACFFIIPWPKTWISFDNTAIASFYPCGFDKLKSLEPYNGGCKSRAGHFMVYRCFFAFGTVMLTNSLIMMFVSSTKEDPHRAKIHQGFWFYKYAYLTIMLLTYFLMLDGRTDPDGVFELICSIIGNISNMVFSFVELTFLLDAIEIWVIANKNVPTSWRNFFYWVWTYLIFLASLVLFIIICKDFSRKRDFGDEFHSTYPYDNCVEGIKGGPDWSHVTMIIASFVLVMFLFVFMCFKSHFRKRYPYIGWIQVSVITFFNFSYLWSALYSSPRIHSRPRCNLALYNVKANISHLQEGSTDVYFRISGFYHGLLIIMALLYYTFVHGPRASSAPLSAAWHCMFSKPKVPVYPDDEGAPPEFLAAVKKLKVWDDEQEEVAYSWSMFYVLMTIGGFSLMMAMTNFTSPWAADFYNSSYPAYGCKFATSFFTTLLFIILTVSPCPQVYPDNEPPKRRRVVRRKRLSADGKTMEEEIVELRDDEEVEPTEVVEYVDEEELAGSISSEVYEVPVQPKNCGCMT